MAAEKVFREEGLKQISDIHQMSALYNKCCGKPHNQQLLELVAKHVEEIRELYEKKDSHYLVETGDLLILCCELLLEGGADIDEVTHMSFGRYERKLLELLAEGKKG